MENQGKEMLQSAQTLILKIAKNLKLADDTTARLINPNHIHTIDIPVIMDDGTTRTFRGYRVQHNNVLGPYKGGIRFHPQVSEEEVMALATLMSIKASAAGIPLGGGKGGIVVDPKELSKTELERLSRGYVALLIDHLGEDTDVPAPDVNTNPQVMAWMSDEYMKYKRAQIKRQPTDKELARWSASFTGKPIDLGGSLGRNEATGRGGVIAPLALMQRLNRAQESLTVGVQGFGNVGLFFSKIASEQGYRIVAVSDSKSGIATGGHAFDIRDLEKHKKEKGTLQGFPKGVPVTNEQLLTLPVDVLVPAALENVISAANMKDVRAKIIVELANGPITEEAYEYLVSKGVVIVPDVFANSGGVIVSFLEWVQGMKNERWDETEVNMQLNEIMVEAFAKIWAQHEKRGIPLKEAAFEVAIERIVNEMK